MKPLGSKKHTWSSKYWNAIPEHREDLRFKGRARSKRSARKEIENQLQDIPDFIVNSNWSDWHESAGSEWDYEKAFHKLELQDGRTVYAWPNAGRFSCLSQADTYFEFSDIVRYQYDLEGQ